MAEIAFICGLYQEPRLGGFKADQVPSFRLAPEGPGEVQRAINREY